LPPGIGDRRRGQLPVARPDFNVVEIRGNASTRMQNSPDAASWMPPCPR